MLIRADNASALRTIFQQEWWLDCATGGQFKEVAIEKGGQTVGWLPYVIQKRWGLPISDMPLLTHTLGPVITPGTGRPNAQLLREFEITLELLEKLPRLAHFRQILTPSSSEALGFQAFGCHVRIQYTFIVKCTNIDERWKGMKDKTRNVIRRSQERNIVAAADPEEFLRFYDMNCTASKRLNRYLDPKTQKLLDLCCARDQGKIYLSKDRNSGATNAGIFVAWDDRCMYFLMSTRQASADSGAVCLLLWEAMMEAHRRGLDFDLDGVTSLGTFKFLSGFGGDLARRLIVEKFNWIYHSLDKIRGLTYGALRRSFD